MKKKLLAFATAGMMIFSLAACGGKEESSKDVSVKNEEVSDTESLEVKENLLSVEITVPASLVGDSEAELDAEMKEAGVKEVTKNEDGSVTMKMSKTAHKKLLDDFKVAIDEGIAEILADKENYTSFDSIKYNDDVTAFDISVDPSTYGGLDSFAAMVFYIEGCLYQAFNAVPEDQINTVVNFVNKDTREIIESGNSAEFMSNPTTE